MPSREPVTLEVLNNILLVVKRNIKEFQAYKCEATICFIIVRLYEYFISYFAYHDPSDKKIANYKSITKVLPIQYDAKALVILRDLIVHNSEKLTNFETTCLRYLTFFTKENFNYLVRESLGEDYLWLYDGIIEYCKTEESSKMALF